ncbi:hypothetical protein VTH06DRAFT_8285 [Thermothelomyces fergusii]
MWATYYRAEEEQPLKAWPPTTRLRPAVQALNQATRVSIAANPSGANRARNMRGLRMVGRRHRHIHLTCLQLHGVYRIWDSRQFLLLYRPKDVDTIMRSLDSTILIFIFEKKLFGNIFFFLPFYSTYHTMAGATGLLGERPASGVWDGKHLSYGHITGVDPEGVLGFVLRREQRADHGRFPPYLLTAFRRLV